jgi:hypothetical protein
MKFNCGPTPEEKCAARKEWHRWFAWRLVRVASGDCRWLEYVERRDQSFYCGPRWEYRALKEKT